MQKITYCIIPFLWNIRREVINMLYLWNPILSILTSRRLCLVHWVLVSPIPFVFLWCVSNSSGFDRKMAPKYWTSLLRPVYKEEKYNKNLPQTQVFNLYRKILILSAKVHRCKRGLWKYIQWDLKVMKQLVAVMHIGSWWQVFQGWCKAPCTRGRCAILASTGVDDWMRHRVGSIHLCLLSRTGNDREWEKVWEACIRSGVMKGQRLVLW